MDYHATVAIWFLDQAPGQNLHKYNKASLCFLISADLQPVASDPQPVWADFSFVTGWWVQTMKLVNASNVLCAKNKPLIWVPGALTGRQKRVCTGRYLSSYRLSLFHSVSLIRPLSPSFFHQTLFLSLSLNSILAALNPFRHNTLQSKREKRDLEHTFYLQQEALGFHAKVFLPEIHGWRGDNVRVPRCGAQPESRPVCTHEIWCDALFKVLPQNH